MNTLPESNRRVRRPYHLALPLALGTLFLAGCSDGGGQNTVAGAGLAGGRAGSSNANGGSVANPKGPIQGAAAGDAGSPGVNPTAGTAGSDNSAGTGNSAGKAGSAGMGNAAGSGNVAGKAGTAGVAGTGAAAGKAGAAGVAGAAGAAGAAGSGGRNVPCGFSSGLNVAWVSFANDVPNPNLTTFNTIFQNTHDAGGRTIRWWFHTNGSVTPGYDGGGLAKPLPQSHIDGVKAILNAANTRGIKLVISLWSFDMLQTNAGTAYTNNKLLLENDTNRQAYIDNYLTPLVTALKGTPGLYAYEIFNEPEGMGPNGWATYRTTQAAIQKTVNWLAAAIHTADPQILVTNGAQTFDTCSTVAGKSNWYSDSALRTVGGRQAGTLDFYQVHYYTSNGASNSPFTHPASYWGLDKKLVIGEFAGQTTDGVAQNNLYTNLYTSGYSGAWAWAYTADWPWPAMQSPMQALYTAHSDVGSCP